MDNLTKYISDHVKFVDGIPDDKRLLTLGRVKKVFSLLPDEALNLFISGERDCAIVFQEDLNIPLGMSTKSSGPQNRRKYVIDGYSEQLDFSEDLFIGCLLRELGHVVAGRPPEEEWPHERGEKARFKERLECIADAMVWNWGLRHYSMIHIAATYPEHWVERIIEDISRVMLEERDKLN